MKKGLILVLFWALSLSLCGFGAHKFYMGLYQVNYASEKRMVQITSRNFIDDLNTILEKKYKKKFYLGSENETPESVEFLKKYLAENFKIKINGQPYSMVFLSKEIDGDVLVCYLRIKDVSKFSSVEITNSVLIDAFSEQQNIVHVSAFGVKKSLLFTESFTRDLLKF